MTKEGQSKTSNRKFFNKTGAIPVIVAIIFIIAVTAGLITVVNINQQDLPTPMLSGHPNCGTISGYCECEDGLDNDNDLTTDIDEDEVCMEMDESHDDECAENFGIFRLSKESGEHAAAYSYEPYPGDYYKYPNSICLPDFGYTESTGYQCTGTNTLFRISGDAENLNGHIEKKGQTNPNYQDYCFGDFVCEYATNCVPGSNAEPYECFASLMPTDPTNNDTNLHIGRCDAYPEEKKLCCYDASIFSTRSPGRSSDSPDVIASQGDRQIPQGGTIVMPPVDYAIAAKLLSGEQISDWEWWEKRNEEVWVRVDSGTTSTINPLTKVLDTAIGDKYLYKFIVHGTLGSTIETESNIYNEIIAVAECGNAVREYSEECDNDIGSPPQGSDGCTATCIVEPGWRCVGPLSPPQQSTCFNLGDSICDYLAGENHQNSPADCQTWCSDNQVHNPNDEGVSETCDDGGKCIGDLTVTCYNNADCVSVGGYCTPINGDGCDWDCQVESGYQCPQEGGPCTFCGDGILEQPETCDDGNTDSDDGCNNICQEEQGWDCSSGVCETVCNDGYTVPGHEICDPSDPTTQTQSCNDFSPYTGEQECLQDCTDYSQCEATEWCGDNTVQTPPEQCEQTSQCPEGLTCSSCNCITTSCFPAGTKILMADNKEKNIEDVRIGDYVTSYDEKTGQKTSARVNELESPIRDHMCEIKFRDETTIKLTDEHPIYSKDNSGSNSWKSIDPTKTKEENPTLLVSKLSIKDKVLTKDQSYKTITSIECWKESIQTYNLKSINEYSTFFAEDILVHNKAPTCFVGDTKIKTPSGLVEIRNLKVGDEVLSVNEKTNEIEPTKITKFNEHLTDSYLVINDWLKVTSNHQVLINGKWTEIGKAKLGDMLTSVGKSQKISSIETVNKKVKVYDIEVEKNHNYITGDIIVHNGISKGLSQTIPPVGIEATATTTKKATDIETTVITEETVIVKEKDSKELTTSEQATGDSTIDRTRLSPENEEGLWEWFIGLFN